MKDDTLTRLLFRRIDLISAVRFEYITIDCCSAKELRMIASSLPYTSWEHNHIDYI
ncbi:MAG: hypothetical protein ACUVTL_10170 [Thermoproteota archaeon]